MVAERHRRLRLLDRLRGAAGEAGDHREGPVGPVGCGLDRALQHGFVEADVADLELRRVHADREPARTGIDIIAAERPLAHGIEFPRRVQGKRMGGDDRAPEQDFRHFGRQVVTMERHAPFGLSVDGADGPPVQSGDKIRPNRPGQPTEMTDALPAAFADTDELEEFMTRPDAALISDLASLDGDIAVLGVGGKMGPTLARMAKRAAPDKRVIGVARFSEAGLEEKLRGWGVEAVRCDLLDRDALAALPDCANVVFMAGRKFGTSGNLEMTWAMNVHVPALVAERYRHSRIVAFSTGNVYPMVDIDGPGANEAVPAAAMGEYAQSCLGRERMFEFFSAKHGTPGRLIRLNYAIDMRYGVLWDIGTKVFAGEEIDLTAGHANVIWQGEANSRILRCLSHCTEPTTPINISGPALSVRAVATAFGERFGRPPRFRNTEDARGWLVDISESERLLGPVTVTADTMIGWLADWIARGGENLNKPTAFDSRDGSF
jgi:hypothetical protein